MATAAWFSQIGQGIVMGKKKTLLSAAVIAGLALSLPANAQMAIDRLWVDIASGKVARSDLVIRNESKDRYYVTVTVSEVVSPGTPEERRVTETDPEKLGLLVTPQRLIMDPGQMRAIRLVSLNRDLARDRVYRVNVTPQVGKLDVAQSDTTSRGIAIKMLTAFDALVTVRPDGARGTLVATPANGMLTLGNTGNSNILLLDGEVCPAKGETLSPSTREWFAQRAASAAATTAKEAAEAKLPARDEATKSAPKAALKADECEKLSGRRLYAGNVWEVPQGPGEVLKFDRRDSASADLKPITISCGGSSEGKSSSAFCNFAGAPGMANGAAASSSHDHRDGETS